RQWLLRPLLDRAAIEARQEAIQALVDDATARAALRARLKVVGDLERLTSRAALGVAHARDLVAVRGFLAELPALSDILSTLRSPRLEALHGDITALPELEKLLQAALEDDPPLALREGGLIREGFNADLRQLAQSAREAKDWITSLEQ